jgi:hypothetical protein
MPVWRPLPVSEDPVIVLVNWRVLSIDSVDGAESSHHFNGYHTTDRGGRVSSKILEYDPKTKTGATRSGRRYQLLGPSGRSADALYVWDHWAQHNDVDADRVTNVTEEYEGV